MVPDTAGAPAAADSGGVPGVYQTAAFPPDERWALRWLAPVRGYHLATRRELIPEQPDHPRAEAVYYKVSLGPLQALPRPIPSRRLRRITFIPTTLARLKEAEEINDLWIKSSAQERLWAALQAEGVAAERQYPLEGEELGARDLDVDPASQHALVADFALPWDAGGVALIVTDEPRSEAGVAESQPPYHPALPGWCLLYATQAEIAGALGQWVQALAGPEYKNLPGGRFESGIPGAI